MPGQVQEPSGNGGEWDAFCESEWEDEDEDEDDYEPGYDADDGLLRDRCRLGAACCVADPYHSSDECYDAEWAEAYFAEQTQAEIVDDARTN